MSEHEFFKHLREDHEEQKKLGKELIETTDPKKRDGLRRRFNDALYPHMVGEEASIFSFLESGIDEKAAQDALEGIQEHHVGKMVLKELMNLSLESDIFKAKIKVLDELNRHHIEEEEDKIFGHLKRICDKTTFDELFQLYEKAESYFR